MLLVHFFGLVQHTLKWQFNRSLFIFFLKNLVLGLLRPKSGISGCFIDQTGVKLGTPGKPQLESHLRSR